MLTVIANFIIRTVHFIVCALKRICRWTRANVFRNISVVIRQIVRPCLIIHSQIYRRAWSGRFRHRSSSAYELNQIGVIHVNFNVVRYRRILPYTVQPRWRLSPEVTTARKEHTWAIRPIICNSLPLFKAVKIRATTEIRVTPRKQPRRVRPLSTPRNASA